MIPERLTVRELSDKFTRALQPSVQSSSDPSKKPLEIDLLHPLPRRIRVYLYNLTSPPGGRTLGEHKIQLIVPGQDRGTRGNFDYSGCRLVFIAGYESDLDVFVLWDSIVYPDFAYSMNVQVKAETVYSASTGKVVTQERRLHSGSLEVVVASTSNNLAEGITMRRDLSLSQLLSQGDTT